MQQNIHHSMQNVLSVTNQIFFADRIVVNHCHRATDEQINKCHKYIHGVKWKPIFNAIQGIVNINDFRVPSTVEASTVLLM
ncbi:MAG: hypothetical protein AAFV71_33310 [Cyanobacteria bacterium J06633_8]